MNKGEIMDTSALAKRMKKYEKTGIVGGCGRFDTGFIASA